MTQQYLFEGWQVQRTVLDIPGLGKVSVNPADPPYGFEALFPEGRMPAYHDVAEFRATLQVARIAGGSGVDKESGTADSEFERTIKFVTLRRDFEVVSLQPYRELRDTA